MKFSIPGCVVVVAALLAGCIGDSGAEFVGKWVHVKATNRIMVIERNGESFIVRNTEPSFITGKLETRNIPAMLKDGTLQVQMGALGTAIMAIDSKSGRLTNGQTEYRKAR